MARSVLGQINLPMDQAGWSRAVTLLHSLFRKIDVELSKATYRGEASWTPPNIGIGSSATTTVIVPDAAVGDHVRVFPPATLSGLTVSGYVSATGTVTIVLANNTSGAVTAGAGTWRVIAEKWGT